MVKKYLRQKTSLSATLLTHLNSITVKLYYYSPFFNTFASYYGRANLCSLSFPYQSYWFELLHALLLRSLSWNQSKRAAFYSDTKSIPRIFICNFRYGLPFLTCSPECTYCGASDLIICPPTKANRLFSITTTNNNTIGISFRQCNTFFCHEDGKKVL